MVYGFTIGAVHSGPGRDEPLHWLDRHNIHWGWLKYSGHNYIGHYTANFPSTIEGLRLVEEFKNCGFDVEVERYYYENEIYIRD